jgi:hypothetical protein
MNTMSERLDAAMKARSVKPAAPSRNDVGLEQTSCNVASTYHTAAAGKAVNRTSEPKSVKVKVTFQRGGAVVDTAEANLSVAGFNSESWRLVGGTYGQSPPDRCEYEVSRK